MAGKTRAEKAHASRPGAPRKKVGKPDAAGEAAFAGFPPEALKFLKALGFHQTKIWFDANRALYISALKDPLEAYVTALSAACAKKKLPLKGEPGRATFRLNRDVRFSKDKKPYKTNAGCVLTRTGLKGSPGLLYTHLDPEGCFFAAGFYGLEPDQLLSMRRRIAAKPKEWLAAEKQLKAAGLELSTRDALKRNPRGFETVDEALAAAIRSRHFIVRKPFPDALLQDAPALVKTAADFAAAARPLLDFGWAVLD